MSPRRRDCLGRRAQAEAAFGHQSASTHRTSSRAPFASGRKNVDPGVALTVSNGQHFYGSDPVHAPSCVLRPVRGDNLISTHADRLGRRVLGATESDDRSVLAPFALLQRLRELAVPA
jgi:hypothetical protein